MYAFDSEVYSSENQPQLITRAESVTENRNRYRDILKTETDTDVGIEKNRKPTEKIPKKTKIRFLLMTIY